MDIDGGEILEEMKMYFNQPTDEELHQAWTDAINLEGQSAPFSSAIQKLKELRNKRSTWYGEKENELRRSLNDYLDHYGA